MNQIKCRFCTWTTPVWIGRKSGWVKLTSHVIDKHPHAQIKPVLAAFGTTAKGREVTARQQT